MTREEIYQTLTNYLVEMFEVPPEKIYPEARLYEDLDLDSIDAVDLIVRLQNLTQTKMTPDAFKTVRTIDDAVGRIHEIFIQK